MFHLFHTWRIEGLEHMGRMPDWYVGHRTHKVCIKCGLRKSLR